MRNGDDFSPAVIERISGLLDEFHDGAPPTLSQLSARSGLPRSSVHRLLAQLVEFGWVTRHGTTYALSRTLLEWRALAQRQDALYQAAHPILNELHAATGLVAHLAIIDGADVRYLDKVGHGPRPLPSRIGGRQPALRTALGKAILAHTSPQSSHRPPAASALTTSADLELRREMAHIRERHVAHEHNEAVPEVGCVAAPIGDARNCVGAISLAGPAERVSVVSLAMPVRNAAHTIWRRLGHSTQAPRAAQPIRSA